jgi:hypothetical protein
MHKLFLVFGAIIMILLVDCSKQTDWSPVQGDIMTRWAKEVKPDRVLPEYPRPQMIREEWKNLNGLWEYAIRPKTESRPDTFDGKILVPFPIESALSGMKKPVSEDNKLWYRNSFKVPQNWLDRRILLHFGAVDWETTVWVNGNEVGHHRGGYDAFSMDITDALNREGIQEIVLSVWDPIDSDYQPRGKQVKEPHGIWYTSVTGIWQTVWLEPVPEIYIESITIITDIDEKQVKIKTLCSGTKPDYRIRIKIKAGNDVITEVTGFPFEEISAKIYNPIFWSPDNPFLYDLEVSLVNGEGEETDQIASYFGMRKISLGKDENGINRIFLNNEPIFMHGPLDQGWWPDGLYTPPTDEALRYDIEFTKLLDFNMARKHVKIEPDRWYYWCDKLGLLVWQDMPSGDKFIGHHEPDIERSSESAEQFNYELKSMIDGFFNHPCIVIWVPFNEGWGQFDTERITRWIKNYDPTRLINPASGWADRGVGDVNDIHRYPGPGKPENEPSRAVVLGEFGGLGLPLLDHTWRQDKNWGYRGYQTADELTHAYQELTRKLIPLIAEGLCAAVYTQTTDVEIEVNGLMTYDREVIKMNPETVRLINQGYLSPEIISDDEIFLDQAKIELKSFKGGEIRYTIDGSEPNNISLLYSDPIAVENTTTVRARSFWENGIQSLVAKFTCKKVELTDPVQVENLKPGLTVHYYEGEWDLLPDFSTFSHIFSKTVAEIDLKSAPRKEDFALKFKGFIKVPANGIYTFYSNSDDGSKLYVTDQLIVTNDGLHGMREEYGKIALKAGFHQFSVEFFQKKGGLALEVYVKGPEIEQQLIPSSMLFH